MPYIGRVVVDDAVAVVHGGQEPRLVRRVDVDAFDAVGPRGHFFFNLKSQRHSSDGAGREAVTGMTGQRRRRSRGVRWGAGTNAVVSGVGKGFLAWATTTTGND